MNRYQWLIVVLLVTALSLLYVHGRVHGYDDRIITDLNSLNTRDWRAPRVAVVFGASVYGNGDLSPILADRVNTAIEVFGLKQAVLVSQGFHLSRALYIANELGLDAVGMAGNMKTEQQIDYQGMREWAAELKAYLN